MLSIKNIQWQEKVYNEKIAEYIQFKYQLSFEASCLITSRINQLNLQSLDVSESSNISKNQSNYDSQSIENFLYPEIKNLLNDVYHLKDLKQAVIMIKEAIINKQKICIYGDYDVDGASATSLLLLFLKRLNADIDIYIPDRLSEGYGLNIEAIDKLSKKNIDIIVTVDNGSTAFTQIEYANKKNIQIIVIDHHITEETMPNALIINPNRLDQISPYKNLCATGVTWIFCAALRTAIEKHIYISRHELLNYIDIVALATICDVMELHGLNRFFVQHGIKIMNSLNVGNIGIKNLLNVINEQASTNTIGFKIGAMINAGSRLENSYLAVKLLTENKQTSKLIANQLYNLNETRKNLEKEIFEQAYQQALLIKDKHIIIISSENWHIGIIGIIASRIMEEFNKPCIIISYQNNIGVGSCRSIKSINIGEIIINTKNQNLIINGGGHSMAAGFKIEQQYHDQFTSHIENITPKIPQITKSFDLTLDIKQVNLLLLHKLKILEPYGAGNRNPIFLIKNINIKQIKIIKDIHILCVINNNIKAFAFRAINNCIGHFLLAYKNTKNQSKIHIIATINEFNGQISIIINDIIKLD